MRRFQKIAVVVLVLTFGTLARADTKYLTKDQVDATISLLSPPPVDGSPEQQGEIKTLLELQKNRTPELVARAEHNSKLTGMLFADVLGDWFNAKDLPLTQKMLADAGLEVKAVYSVGKAKFHRNRPFITDPSIHATMPETGFSYPSGHATGGMAYALILAEMFPEHKDELLAKGRQIGEDRELAGVHYPSDVAAGQKVGAEIAKQLLANPEFHAEMEKALDEIHADAHALK
jgi:acid phosphatase (class A)